MYGYRLYSYMYIHVYVRPRLFAPPLAYSAYTPTRTVAHSTLLLLSTYVYYLVMLIRVRVYSRVTRSHDL